ncbi:YDG domain-containing protein [Comamonas nitrativorans]|uniref:YDG domain-containing protein n=1 Tax=Comamonas nitrativorans TaxID=108437 RepID=A0ABV9GZB4_9BURK
MNHTYRLVWNNDTQRYVPAPECAKGKSKSKTCKALAPAAVLLSAAFAMPVWAQVPPANELPTGGNVVSGNATISQNGNQMTVGQGSNKAIIDWTSFNIGKDAAVTFNQLGRDSIALNRVTQGDASQIHGQLNANGQVWLINPNGVVFGAGSKVDVGGLVASTMNIANDDFLNGNYKFSRNGTTGSITNQGELTAKDGGSIALLAPTVSNDGIVTAQLGSVVMAAGDQITLQAGANGLLNVQVDPATIRTLIENKQLIVSDGGQVIMTGKAADALAASVVSNTGTIQANTLQERDGKILLIADMQHGETQAAGKLEAKFIDTSAATVSIDKNLKVNTNGGEWLIDPVGITIDAGKAGAIQNALGSGNVTVSTSNNADNTGWNGGTNGTGSDKGDIHVNADISYSANKLTLNADRNINLNAAINVNGSGTLALNYGGTQGSSSATPATGSSINASFGANGGFAGKVNFAQSGAGRLDINGSGYSVIKDAAALQDMNSGLSGKYALGGDVDASGINNFAPIGGASNSFTGVFDGLGHTISGLTINRKGQYYVGLFGNTSNSLLRNVGLEGGSTTGGPYTGGLVGNSNDSSISHSYATGSITGGEYTGGLVGNSDNSSISQSYATGSTMGGGHTGGLVGESYNSSISQSYATGNTTGTGMGITGGLVGNSYGSSISQSYATGSTTGRGAASGGLVGFSFSSSINQSYATGSTMGGIHTGGLVGDIYGDSSINNAYYATTDADGKAINQGAGYNTLGTARTYAQLTDASTYAGWDTNIWQLQLGGRGAAVEGYETGRLAFLKNVTRAQDVQNTTWFDGGWGTAAAAYGIANWGQLSNMGLLLDKHYQLNNDLDSTTSGYAQHASATANGGAGWQPIGDNSTNSSASRFTGIFDGQGHTIGGLTINRPGQDRVGLFGYTSTATLRNVGLVGIKIVGRSYAGGLVGYAYNGSIRHTYATGEVGGVGGRVGGLVGGAYNGNISQVYATAKVNGSSYVGGLVGYLDGGGSSISQAYATGEVVGTGNSVGGLVGIVLNGGSISHAYATGKVSGSSQLGGLVGSRNDGTIQNAYYATTDAAGNSTGNTAGGGVGSVGKTWLELGSASTYSGWAGVGANWEILGRGAAEEGYEIALPSLIGVTRAEDVTRSTLFADGWGTADSAYGIANWGQLSNMSLLLDKHYQLNNDLSSSTSGYAQHASATAHGGQGWQPIGDDSTPFTGSFDGQGHTIGGLHIDRPSQDYVGLFGETMTASVQQVGLIDAQVTGRDYVGSLVGFNGNSSNISHSYASGGVVQGHGNGVGGLAGFNAFDSSIGHSYASSDVQATNSFWVGGLVGSNLDGSTISNSYATGAVTAGSSWYVGGLVGENDGSTIAQSYATGLVAGGRALGGLVGSSYDSSNDGDSENDRDRVDNSYYATTDAAGDIIHNNGATNKGWGGNAHGTGKTLNELKNLSTFADWGADIDDQGGTGAVWRIYEGQSGPLLRSFLKQVTVTADALNASPVTYNGNAVSVSTGYTPSDPGAALDGSLAYTTSSKNAGDYSTTAGTLALGGLYSGQQGYDISYANTDASLTIDKAELTVTGTTVAGRTYNGSTDVLAQTAKGTVTVFDNDQVTLGVTSATLDSKNAGSRTATVAYALTGGDAGNYTVSDTAHNVAIERRALTVSGITTDSKIYDGTTDATVRTDSAVLDGLVAGDDLHVSATGQFHDKRAGTAKTVTLTSSYSGADRNNYDITGQADTTADIDRKALTVSGITADNKTYDGMTNATLRGDNMVLDGLVAGDDLHVIATGQFSDKHAGTDKTVTLTSGYAGIDVLNYAITNQADTTADIDRRVLTVSGITVDSKTYDGTTDATVRTDNAVLDGLVHGDDLRIDSITGVFEDKHAGTGKKVILSSSYVGTDAGNYAITGQADTTADIDRRALTVSGITADSKTYDGTTNATVRTDSAMLDGLVHGDDLRIDSIIGVFEDKHAGIDTGTIKTVILTSSYSGADRNNYDITSQASATAEIERKALTVSGITAERKTYDGTTDATVHTDNAVLDGLVAGDDLRVVATGQFSDKNAGTDKTVILTSGYAGIDVRNYAITDQTDTTADIDRRALFVSGITADSKTYDGTTDATVHTSGAQSAGLLHGDDVRIDSITGVFEDKHAGTDKKVILTSSYSGADRNNYDIISQASATADIDRRALTVSGITAERKTYDGSTVATVNTGGAQFDGLVAGDNLTVSATGVFDSKNAGQGKTVTLTSRYAGADAGNYAITDQADTTADIDRKALTVTGTTVAGRTYNGSDDVLAQTAKGIVTVFDNDQVTLDVTSATLDSKNAGSRTATVAYALTGDDADNYTVADSTHSGIEISQKALTVTGTTVAGKTYDSTATANVTATGTLNQAEVIDDDTVTLTQASGSFADKNAGKDKAVTVQYTLGGADGGNYFVADNTDLTATIDKAELTVTGTSVAGRTYDGSTDVLAQTGTGTVTVYSGDDVTLDVTSATLDSKNAGTRTATVVYKLTGTDADNYTVLNSTHSGVQISQKALTVGGITADNKTYDGGTAATVNTGSVQFDGLVAGDNLTVSTTGQFSDKNAAQGKTVTLTSHYDGTDRGNYAITDQTTTTADIDRKALTISGITADNKTYDGSTFATVNTGGAQFDGLVDGDDLRVIATGQFSDKNADQGKTVTLTSRYSGVDAGNYAITDQTSTSADIDRKALTVGGITADHKTYDGSTVAMVNTGGAQFDGLLAGDNLAVSATGVFDNKNAGQGKTVTLTSRYSGADAGNYAITDQDTTTADIDRKALTVAGTTVADKTYDGNAHADVRLGTISGWVGEERLNISVSGTFDNKNAGTGKHVDVAYTLSDGDNDALAGNYRLTDGNSYTADIERKALTVGGITADRKTYDGSTAATVRTDGAQFDGLVAGDNLTVSTTGQFSDKNAGQGKTVTLTSRYGGADAGNYAITDQTSTTADIDRKALTVGGITADNKTYDGSTAATVNTGGAQFDGLVEGDDLRVTASGVFSDKNAAQGKTVTLTSRYGGADVDNYAITDQTSTTADIDRKALTVGGITADNKTYDGSTVAMVNTGGAQFDGLVEGDDLRVTASGVFDDKNAGQGKTVTLTSRYSGADVDNYAITDQATATADIDRKALVVSGITADRKTYDGSTVATVRTDGAQLDGLVDGDDLRITASGQFGDKNAGVGKTVNVTATVGGTDAGNYDVTFNRTARADIDRLAITGTVTADGKTYDGTLSAVTHGSLSGVLQGDDLSVASTGGSFTDKNAGRGKTVNVTATVSGTDAGNYDVTFNRTAQADIAARALTITVRNATRPAGVALALSGSIGFTASGLVQGETVGSVTLDSAGAPADAVAGTYAIAASNAVGGHGFDAANYDIQYVDGSLTVISPMNGGVIWRLAQGQSDPRPHWLQDAASVQTASSGVPYLTLAPGFIPVPGEESARD